MKPSNSVFLLTAVALASCQVSQPQSNQSDTRAGAPIAPVLATADAVDAHSFARPQEARVSHVALDLSVDFDTKRIGGTAALDIARRPDAREIILDDKGLEIASVTDGSKQPLAWKVGAQDPNLGAPLAISLKPDT